MLIKHNMNYIDDNKRKMLDMGYGELTVNCLKFDRYYTEAEREENRKLSHILSADEWSNHCEGVAKNFSEIMKEILQKFVEKYDIHQVTEETSTLEHYRSDWDLHFWSDRGWNNKDYMTQFHLTFNHKRSAKSNNLLLKEIEEMLQKLEYENIICYVQYMVSVDEKQVKEAASASFNAINGKLVKYNGLTGKVKKVMSNGEEVYGFFRKSAKKKFTMLSNTDLITAFQSA